MNDSRAGFTATLLSNSKVLIAGGMDNNFNFPANVEIYDPIAATFSVGPRLFYGGRVAHTATLLSK
jgi:hypothetical protein